MFLRVKSKKLEKKWGLLGQHSATIGGIDYGIRVGFEFWFQDSVTCH